MHVYIYDDFLVKRKHENLLAGIETRITDLGMNGKIIRLGNMKSTLSLLENELRQGIKTVVAVGNDATVNKVLNKIIRHQTTENIGADIPLGIIPIEAKNNSIAFSLGIKNEEEACDILSARRIEKLDVGQVAPLGSEQINSRKYFLSRIFVPGQKTRVELDKKYSIELTDRGEMFVFNLPNQKIFENSNSKPQDGKMELVIKDSKNKKTIFGNASEASIFSFDRLAVTSQLEKSPQASLPETQILLDDFLPATLPVEISILKKKLNVIVGKERNF